ncbi:DnaB-like helicase N-terminal domain-containing protein [Sulfuricurvum sp.]|uniref:DnaB-like helicase N-terminal domain-containing protein n=1 Tax=Sulfuricurvum sp. TaxID=2025608 RepID=UPI00262B92E0|nr:DnaB-like helicase N-terminal domain-containing protein [Sulfuricurvum sp.]MDD2267491.1 DnaB-like helicase N-terminal domain-containing protein [Sulfuricurvum sp.]MDD2783961.1 DnaB-like helicase N-terminal domain-containing protein [Sulfuricurvum sp.]
MEEQLYNLAFERSALSSFIFSPELFGDVIDTLKPHHFYLNAHQNIYETMQYLYRSDKPIDESFIRDELVNKKKFDEKVMVEILITTPINNLSPYIAKIKELYTIRELLRLTTLIKQQVVEENKTSDQIIAEVARYIDILEMSDQSRAKSFSQLKREYLLNPPAPIYPTGVSFIDEALNGGFEMGQLILVSGDPEAGKTILTMQILKNITKMNPAVLFAFEFTTDSLVKLQMRVESEAYENVNLQIIDDGYDIVDLEREIKIWAKRGARFFVIDSQMRIENAANNGTMEDRESEKFSRLAKLAHKLNIDILLIIQNSKADAAASVISPMGTKKGAHEASIIIHLKRLKDDPENGKKEMREIIFSKNKQTGQHFKGEVNFNPYTLMFTRPYGAGGTETKYTGHIPVEHQDAGGKTTGQSSMSLIGEQLSEIAGEGKIDMAQL